MYSLILAPGRIITINQAQADALNRAGLIVWKRCHSAYVPERGVKEREIDLALRAAQSFNGR